MITVGTILIVIALVCFILDAIKVPTRVNLTALGLAFVAAAMLLGRMVVA